MHVSRKPSEYNVVIIDVDEVQMSEIGVDQLLQCIGRRDLKLAYAGIHEHTTLLGQSSLCAHSVAHPLLSLWVVVRPVALSHVRLVLRSRPLGVCTGLRFRVGGFEVTGRLAQGKRLRQVSQMQMTDVEDVLLV